MPSELANLFQQQNFSQWNSVAKINRKNGFKTAIFYTAVASPGSPHWWGLKYVYFFKPDFLPFQPLLIPTILSKSEVLNPFAGRDPCKNKCHGFRSKTYSDF